MSHWGRRLWRWSAALFALLVILLATLVGLIRLASPLVPGYRAEVEQWASTAIHHPVQIRSMGAEWGWHGPEVALVGVRILSHDRTRVVVSADEVNLGLSLWSLLHGSLPRPNRIVLVGPQVEVHRDAEGVFTIAGLEGTPQHAPTDWRASLREVFSQSATLVVSKGRLTYVEAGEPHPLLFQGIDIQLDNAADNHDIAGDVQLPADFGRSLGFELKVKGEGIDTQQWDWQSRLTGTGLQLPRLMRYWKEYDGRFARGNADLDARVQVSHGVLQAVTVETDANDVVPVPGTSAATAAAVFKSISGKVSWTRDDRGWKVTGSHVQLARGTLVWPKTDFTLEYATATGGTTWSGSAGFLRLQDLVALAAWLPSDLSKDLPRLAAFAPTGDIATAAFKLRMNGDTPGDWAAKTRFQDLGVKRAEGWPGFSGMDGSLDMDQTGGNVTLATQDANVDFTPLFRGPMHADSLDLSAKVTHDASGWLVAAGAFKVANADAAAHGKVSMQFPADGSAPRLDLDATVDRADARNKSVYFPVGIMPKDVVHWLDTAIVGGTVVSGGASIHGKTSDFPYRTGGGVFDIRFHLLHGELDYADGWPAVKDLDADVRFLDQGLEARASGGKVADDNISDATARFADLATGVLTIDGFAKGNTENALRFLQSAPLKDLIGGYLDGLQAAGDADTNLHLLLPVEDLDKFELHGVTTLRGASLAPIKLPGLVLDQLQGALSFDRDGLSTRGVDGRLLGGPVHVIIHPSKGKKKATEFSAQGSALAEPLMELFKPMPGGWLEGAAAWRLDGRIPDAPATNTAGFNLSLRTDMQGMAVNLPAPFTKQQDETLPLSFGLKLLGQDTLSSTAAYGDAVEARLDFTRTAKAWNFDRGDLHLGEGSATLPQNPGFTLTGALDEFSWDDWKPFMPSATAAVPAAEPPQSGGAMLPSVAQGVDLTIGSFKAFGQSLDQLHLVMARTPGGWQAKLDSAAAAGTLILPTSVDADHPLQLNMDRLLLSKAPTPTPAAGSAAAAVAANPAPQYDPRRIPALHFSGKRLEYGELKLGGASFSLMPLQDGVALEDLKVDSDSFDITGDGTWTVTPAGLQRSSLNMDVKSKDVGKSFQALGYAPAITGSKGEMNAAIYWQDSPFGDLVHTLGGNIHVKLEDGQIVDVQPGAGRVFGLLSLNALPRRILLNFSDVFSKGFGYDTIEGDFTLQNGDAYTKDMQVKGPAAKITLIGRTGIANRDFDEALIVDADVGSTLPVVGALAAGVGVGAVVFLLTEIFKKPLTAAGQTQYHLTGTWDNPVLTKQAPSKTPSKPSP